MAGTKEIKRRIKSVKSTKKITGAMELVAASKMKRSIDGATMTRPYTHTLKSLAAVIAKSMDKEKVNDDFQKTVAATKTLIVVVASNRGLCGGYNTQIGRALARYVAKHDDLDFVTVGKKADLVVRRVNRAIQASFHDLPDTITVKSTQPLLRYIERAYQSGQYIEVKILYTEFKSALSQQVDLQTLLPVKFDAPEGATDTLEGTQEYIIEPSPERVLESLSSRYLASLLYQYLQESRASEHSARMVAMKNAKDAAGDMVDGLSLEYNKARQAGITREIAEISAGQLTATN